MLTFPDLNRLRIFLAVYQTRNLVVAANRLGVTRSAVSQSLKAMEEELNLRLFIRNSKKILPTEAAEILFQSAEPLITGLQQTLQRIAGDRDELAGTLRIGAPQDFGSLFLTEAIVRFRQLHPGVNFELSLAIPVPLLQMVTDNKLDLAFVDNGDVHANNFPVSVTTIRREKFILTCSKKYARENGLGARPSLENIKKLEFVDYLPTAPVIRMWFRHHYGRAARLDPRISFAAESVRAVIKAIQGGLGAGVVPEQMVEDDLRLGRLISLPGSGRELVNQITLTRRLDRQISAREKAFVSFIKEFQG